VSFLTPWFLVAAAAAAVPVFLHLFQRRNTVRLTFPALRYLERTKREHAREIRLRQWLLLALRVGALLVLVLAGARPFLAGPGSSHPPTAVVLVLDNSLSSGRVVGEERVLDIWKRLAEETLDQAGPDDVFWVILAGEPWLPSARGSVDEVRAVIRRAEVSAARGDLTRELERASELLRTSSFEHVEIHLVSDLQRTGFDLDRTPPPAGDIPVVVWFPDEAPPANRGVAQALVGGGLPPLAGNPTEVTVRLTDPHPISAGVAGRADGMTAAERSGTDAQSVSVRLWVDGQIRSAATIDSGSEIVFPLPAAGSNWVLGMAEADPDALSLDDRRYFAYRSRPAPTVRRAGDLGSFAEEAFAVLRDAGRIVTAPGPDADVLVSVDGSGLEALRSGDAGVVVPPADPTRLPALVRNLEGAGVGWRYAPRERLGGAELDGTPLPPGLEGVRFEAWYGLESLAAATGGGGRVLAEVAGDPWAVEVTTAAGARVLLLASPLDLASSRLPVSPGLVRFLDWAVGEWAAAGGSTADRLAGDPLSAPAGATQVVTPPGDTLAIDGSRQLVSTGAVGHYTFLGDDGGVVSVVAVNPPPSESDLTQLDSSTLGRALGVDVTTVSDVDAWSGATFRVRRGPEITWPLLLLAGLLLVLESLVAAAGGTASSETSRPRRPVPYGAP